MWAKAYVGRMTTALAAGLLALIALGANSAAKAASVVGQGTWETTLLGRDINGNPVASNSGTAVFFMTLT